MTKPAGKIVVIGEGMIEFARDEQGVWCKGQGGDTLNTALHLARYGRDVAYLTALGADPFSRELRDGWVRGGIDTDMVLTTANANVGIYAIETDANGERSFAYWRDGSAAHHMFDLPGSMAAYDRAAGAALVVFSLITLAILPERHRATLLDLAKEVRGNGGAVAFDGNYRPRLWTDVAEARRWRDRALTVTSIGLPTLEDEILMGQTPAAHAVMDHWRQGGAGEVILKLGANGCLLPDGRTSIPCKKLTPRDTSGAGDGFNAAYLHARMHGLSPEAAAAEGHRLAGWVVMRPGAVPDCDDPGIYRS